MRRAVEQLPAQPRDRSVNRFMDSTRRAPAFAGKTERRSKNGSGNSPLAKIRAFTRGKSRVTRYAMGPGIHSQYKSSAIRRRKMVYRIKIEMLETSKT